MTFGQWFGFFCLLISLYILWQVKQLLLLAFTAIVLSTALNRLVRKLHSLGVDRKIAMAGSVILSLLAIALFFVLIVPAFINQFQELIKLVPDVVREVRSELIGLNEKVPGLIPPIPTTNDIIEQGQAIAGEILTRFFAFFSNTVGVFLQLLLVLVLTIMLLVNSQGYRQAGLQLFPSFYRRRADAILSKCEIALGNWLAGLLINSLFIATLSGIGLSILQVKLVLVHALLAGLLNFIPNIGPTMSVIFPVMVALLDAPWKALAVIIWYVIIQNIETYWLSPVVMARQVSLLPAVTLGAQIFFTTFFGPLGLILALPLTVVAKTWIEESLFKDILDKWKSDRPSSTREKTGIQSQQPEA
ncbi:MAG: AI-2E family transporter [Okeania sp. SIO2H7]|nr:AI-2E family transporter [Okeania sp. SIO2H7]